MPHSFPGDADGRGPGVKFPPPLLVVLVVGTGYLIDLVKPWPVLSAELVWLSGAVLILIALLIAVTALFQFLEASTHIEPWRPTTTILKTGVFRYSRNPIYLAFVIATAGGGLVLNSWWILLGVPLLIWLLQQLIIKREEVYLASKFGEEYLDYRKKVRRWL